MNGLGEIRLYAVLLREEDLRWLDKWLQAGDSPGSEQPRVISAIQNVLETMRRKES